MTAQAKPPGRQASVSAAWAGHHRTATVSPAGSAVGMGSGASRFHHTHGQAPFAPPDPQQLVDPALLAASDKILFVAHLALGDFCYLQSCFRAFAQAYPHLKLHLWVDERRRTAKASAWPHLKKYALYDWLDECPWFDKVYKETYSPALYRASLQAARAEAYPIVISLAELERHKYALLARKISPDGFVVGQKKRVRRFDIIKHLIYRKLDAALPARPKQAAPGEHISDIYADWFRRLFGLRIAPSARFPTLQVDERWRRQAREQFAAWGFLDGPADLPAPLPPAAPVIFLNAYSKSVERSWPLERVVDLVRAMQADPAWRDAGFVVNAVPEDLVRARALFARENLARTHLFSAEDNFFQLPAVLGLCSLVVTVETAVMHLANAVHVPVIALMRQRTPEWAPIDKHSSTVLTVPRSHDWVDRIGVAEVMAALAQARAR